MVSRASRVYHALRALVLSGDTKNLSSMGRMWVIERYSHV